MASLIANTGAGSAAGNTITTSAIDTTGANLLVLSVSDSNSVAIGTVSDSKGNTWTPRTAYSGATARTKLFYVASPTVGSGHTFTYTVTGSFPTICVIAFAGAHATPYDTENGFAQTSSPGGTINPGSITPSEDNCVLVSSLMALDNNAGSTIDSGFTISNTVNFAGGAHYEGAMAYIIQTTATAKNPTWSGIETGALAAATVASFKAAAAGGSPSRGLTMMGIG